MSADPAPYVDNVAEWSAYVYVRDQPTNLSDPSGLCPDPATCAALVEIGTTAHALTVTAVATDESQS